MGSMHVSESTVSCFKQHLSADAVKAVESEQREARFGLFGQIYCSGDDHPMNQAKILY